MSPKFTSYMDLSTLQITYRCCSESSSIICKWKKQWCDVIGSSLSLLIRPLACERRAFTLSRRHQRSIVLCSSFISPCNELCASILYVVTAIHDYDTLKNVQSVWFFNLCSLAWDAIQLTNVKLFTKHAPGDW